MDVSLSEPSESDSAEPDLRRRWGRSSTGVDFGRGGGIIITSSSCCLWSRLRLARTGAGVVVDPEWRRRRTGISGTTDMIRCRRKRGGWMI
jgi:hypothetical protein